MRTDAGIHGLTTAATIWVNAAVGVAAGGGEYHLAFIATAVTLGVLLVLQRVEHYLDRRLGATLKSEKGPDANPRTAS